ncbi:MAG: hypothetical protein ACOC7V_11765 [Spirochaetota bacterium]
MKPPCCGNRKPKRRFGLLVAFALVAHAGRPCYHASHRDAPRAGPLFSPIAVLIVLAAAYRTGDLSLAYPVARALPVLLVPVVTAFLGIGEPVSPLGAAGMVTVVVGLLLVVHRSFATVGLSSFFFRPRGRARVRADFAALDKRLTMLAGVGIVVAYGLVLVAFGFAETSRTSSRSGRSAFRSARFSV